MPTARTRSSTERPAARELSWWAISGGERCPLCLLTYHVETEYRCAACDAPLCPDCATTRLDVELVCVDCSREAGEAR